MLLTPLPLSPFPRTAVNRVSLHQAASPSTSTYGVPVGTYSPSPSSTPQGGGVVQGMTGTAAPLGAGVTSHLDVADEVELNKSRRLSMNVEAGPRLTMSLMERSLDRSRRGSAAPPTPLAASLMRGECR